MTYKHNIPTVKSIFYIGLLSLVVGCNTATNESQSLADLKTQKKELVNQLNNISIKLKSVESAISDLDTLKRLVTVTSFKAEEKNFNHYIEVQGVVKARNRDHAKFPKPRVFQRLQPLHPSHSDGPPSLWLQPDRGFLCRS